MINVLDLFSGIGGFSYGLEKAGMKTIAFCEINENCNKTLNKHWPNIPIFTDIKQLNKEKLNNFNIDLICGGFPCQDISIATNSKKSKGIQGPKSGLWFEMRRIIDEIKPNWIIIENVPMLRSKGLGFILKNLWEIGYDAEWHIISASHIGASHMRERLWIIAYPCSTRLQRPILNRETFSLRAKQEKSQLCNNINVRCGNSWITNIKNICLDDGLSLQMDKLAIEQYGNSLIPQIVENIGKIIIYNDNI